MIVSDSLWHGSHVKSKADYLFYIDGDIKILSFNVSRKISYWQISFLLTNKAQHNK